MKLEFSPAALGKLKAIHRYISIELQNPKGAESTVKSIREIIRVLKKTPEIGAPLTSRFSEVPERFMSVRVLFCGKYLAVYQYEKRAIRVLQIYHATEDYVRHLFDIW